MGGRGVDGEGGEEQEQPENPEKPGNGEETEPDPNEEITILIPAICFKNSGIIFPLNPIHRYSQGSCASD